MIAHLQFVKLLTYFSVNGKFSLELLLNALLFSFIHLSFSLRLLLLLVLHGSLSCCVHIPYVHVCMSLNLSLTMQVELLRLNALSGTGNGFLKRCRNFYEIRTTKINFDGRKTD